VTPNTTRQTKTNKIRRRKENKAQRAKQINQAKMPGPTSVERLSILEYITAYCVPDDQVCRHGGYASLQVISNASRGRPGAFYCLVLAGTWPNLFVAGQIRRK